MGVGEGGGGGGGGGRGGAVAPIGVDGALILWSRNQHHHYLSSQPLKFILQSRIFCIASLFEALSFSSFFGSS